MKYVECDGWVFSLTDRNYRTLQREIAADHDVNLNKLGRVVATNVEKLYDLQAQARRRETPNEDES